MKVKPPATYQGGKQRLAAQILDIIKPTAEGFADLCCGSGALAIEARSRGIPAAAVTMVDCGPWGIVWEEVAEGRFDLVRLRRIADAVPTEVAKQADFIRELLRQPASIDTAATYLILQAGAFGGKAVALVGDRWSCTARGAWQHPTDPKKHTGTMMPCAAEVVRRMEVLCGLLFEVKASRGDFLALTGLHGVVYVDPPYVGTSGYDGKKVAPIDFDAFARRNPDADLWVSEARAMGLEAVMLSAGRTQGGIKGKRAKPNEEWLNCVARAGEWDAHLEREDAA